MSDMSWLGLYKRGIKVQYRKICSIGWYPLNDYDVSIVEYIINSCEYKFRYKHSIQ